MTKAGDAGTQVGLGTHVQPIPSAIVDEYFCKSDSEMTVMPDQGRIRICIEFGNNDEKPGAIVVIAVPSRSAWTLSSTRPRGAIGAKITAPPSRCLSVDWI